MLKVLFIIVFLLIVFSLASALYHLVNNKAGAGSGKTVKALTFRIGLSLVLFILLAIALFTGIIQSHGIGSKIHSVDTESMPSKP
jgi:hypothetical protein